MRTTWKTLLNTRDVVDFIMHGLAKSKRIKDYRLHETTTGSKVITIVFKDGLDATYNITVTRSRSKLK
jgi:hypothetical protein